MGALSLAVEVATLLDVEICNFQRFGKKLSTSSSNHKSL